MIRVLIASLLLAVLLIVIPINSAAIQNVCESTVSLIDETIEASLKKDFSSAERSLSQAIDQWHTQETYFGIIFKHSEFDCIGVAFEEASASLALHDIPMLLPKLRAARIQIKRLGDSEKIRIDNIF